MCVSSYNFEENEDVFSEHVKCISLNVCIEAVEKKETYFMSQMFRP